MNKKNLLGVLLIIIILVLISIIYFVFIKNPTLSFIKSHQSSPTSLISIDKTENLSIKEIKEFNLQVKGSHPKFSPDGNKILFESRGEDEGLWMIDNNGSNLENIYKGALSAVDDYEWSPDGNFIFTLSLFKDGSNFNNEVLNIINVKNREVKQVFGPVRNILYPEWISENEVAFIYESYNSDEEKWSSNNFAIIDVYGEKKDYENEINPVFFYGFYHESDGSKTSIRSITRSGGIKDLVEVNSLMPSPNLSFDGKKILFKGQDGLTIMNTDGSERKLIINEEGESHSLSPNNKIVVYDKTKDDGHFMLSWDIYAVNTDGTGKVQLTNSKKNFASSPRWSPDGNKIVFSYQETGIIGLIVFE